MIFDRIFNRKKFEIGTKVWLQLGSGAERRRAEVIESGRLITKLTVFYTSNGKDYSFDGWFKHCWITKTKKKDESRN